MILSRTRLMFRRRGLGVSFTTPRCPPQLKVANLKNPSLRLPGGPLTGALTGEFVVTCKLLPDKWSDHKVLEWQVEGLRTGGLPSYKLRQTSDLRKPEDVSQEQWEEAVGRQWACQAHRRENRDMTEWEQLSAAVEDVLRGAHRELGSQRRFTTKNYKGRVAAAIPDGRHHKPDPQGVPKVRATRLRRFGRRLEQWHRSPEPSLSQCVIREAAFCECPRNPLDPNSLPELREWLQRELTNLEKAQREKRLQDWKQKMQQHDGPVWKWLAKAKKTEVACGLLKFSWGGFDA